MKKLIFCCLVVLMGACKDKEDDNVEPDIDYAPDFVGNYSTKTIDGPVTSDHSWKITSLGKNKLGILYVKDVNIAIAGSDVDLTQEYNLVDVKVDGKDSFTINESVDVKQSNEKPLNQLVTGTATKVAGTGGVTQLNITLKLGSTTNEYLEFKKE